jgi:hypothetical protein
VGAEPEKFSAVPSGGGSLPPSRISIASMPKQKMLVACVIHTGEVRSMSPLALRGYLHDDDKANLFFKVLF